MLAGDLATIGSAAPLLRPRSWSEALELRTRHPGARPICGGTDVMVEINFGRSRPDRLLDISGIVELRSWSRTDTGMIRLGAAMPFTRIVAELGSECPALATASRTVGSPQIRNRGTVGGNLATASPAGDCHPALLACRAQVEVESIRGARLIDIDDFFVGPKRSALEHDELIRAVLIPAANGPQQFAKIGPRNAMVIATVSFAISIDPASQQVGTGIGSAAPTPLRSPEAERFLEAELAGRWPSPGPVDNDALDHFGRTVAAAASPIDDVRGTAAYRRRALAVLARRCASWAWADLESRKR